MGDDEEKRERKNSGRKSEKRKQELTGESKMSIKKAKKDND